MKQFIIIILINLSLSVCAQEVNPNAIRVKIYDTILNDIQKQNLASINKQIVIDPTINKFDDYKMDEFGLKLDSVRYAEDSNFCGKTSVYKCVSKFEIDRYSITNVYKDKNEAVYPDFYGIYSPIDHWYNLIYYAAVKHFEKARLFNFKILLPVRHVWMKNAEMTEEMYFYQFELNQEFKILKFEKLFLKH